MNICAPHIATILALTFSGPAAAETYCVDTPAELQTAIDLSESNAEQDEIRIATGTYARSPRFLFQSTQSNRVTFRGGYSANCALSNQGNSTIDGEFQRIGLQIQNLAGDTVVENLTFSRGYSFGNEGGGLHVQSTTGDIRIDRNTFFANQAQTYGGALNAWTQEGTLLVRNNLALGNSAEEIGGFLLNVTSGEGLVVGNTITANSSVSGFRVGGLAIVGNGIFIVSNNIIWGNLPNDPEALDSDFLGTALHDRYANDIGVVSKLSNAVTVVGELSVDPQFASCGFFCVARELERSSPLVDAGEDSPIGGMTTIDLAGKPRVIGSLVDIGAYENDLIFTDGFD